MWALAEDNILMGKLRVPSLLSGILDAISFALFYLSFSALAFLISAMWYQLSAEK